MLRIDDQYPIPKGSTATVKPVGIFGDVAVALTPPMPVPAGLVLAGRHGASRAAAADIGQIMNRVDSIGQTLSVLMTELADSKSSKQERSRTSTAPWRRPPPLSLQLQSVVAEQNATSRRRWNHSARPRDT